MFEKRGCQRGGIPTLLKAWFLLERVHPLQGQRGHQSGQGQASVTTSLLKQKLKYQPLKAGLFLSLTWCSPPVSNQVDKHTKLSLKHQVIWIVGLFVFKRTGKKEQVYIEINNKSENSNYQLIQNMASWVFMAILSCLSKVQLVLVISLVLRF